MFGSVVWSIAFIAVGGLLLVTLAIVGMARAELGSRPGRSSRLPGRTVSAASRD